MAKWDHSTAETYYGDARPSESSDCRVSLENGRLQITYENESGEMRWIGDDLGGGHFSLFPYGPVSDGRAIMHMIPQSRLLDGWWKENGFEGMWRITLSQ